MKANGTWQRHYSRPHNDVTPHVAEIMTEILFTFKANGQQFNVTMDWLEASQLADALNAAATKAEQHTREPGDEI